MQPEHATVTHSPIEPPRRSLALVQAAQERARQHRSEVLRQLARTLRRRLRPARSRPARAATSSLRAGRSHRTFSALPE